MRTILLLALVACSSKSADSSKNPPAQGSSTNTDQGSAKIDLSAATTPAQIVALGDRTEHDRKLDPGRKPVDMLTFFALAPGMRVADLGAGSGYTTELVARSVGPKGVVFAQDSPNWDGPHLQNAWTARTKRPGLEHTTHVMRQWDQPLPPEATDLDVVTFVCAYHDVIAEKSDTAKLDAAVFAALKSGGTFIIIDNSATDGSGAADAEKYHRVDEKLVRDELQKAGFKFVADASFLRNPDDKRDWNADPDHAGDRAHTQDRFVLKFQKP